MTCIPYRIRVHSFLAPKQGTEPFECEDAVAFNVSRGVFAIADGATEAYDSRTWARLLVKSWVRIDPPALEMKDLEPLVSDLGRRLHAKWSKRKLPWYAEEKSLGGSFAAFVLMRLHDVDRILMWEADALGDCCLIHRRELSVRVNFPIARSEDFGSNPVLLPSVEPKQRPALDGMKRQSGTAKPGDDFLLLSDAVAQWFLKEQEDGDGKTLKLLDSLTGADDQPGLIDFFDELRKSKKIRNDDVAILRIEIP